MTPPDPSTLKALAEAATQGPWEACGLEFGCFYIMTADGAMVADQGDEADLAAVARARGYGAGLPMRANAAFIAAANPQTVLALLAERATLIAERDQARADYQFMVDKAANNNLQHYREMGRETLVQIERAEAAEAALAAIRAERDMLQYALDTEKRINQEHARIASNGWDA